MSAIPAYLIRFHGRRYLKMTRPDPFSTAQSGWRSLTWTASVAEAEKWADETAARIFAQRNLRGGYAVVPA